MALNNLERQQVVYFTGYEVEHTVCYGMKTLFVVGTPPVDQIVKRAQDNEIKHIYFGTSQSFRERNYDWDEVILACLERDFWVTLDFGVEHINDINSSDYSKYPKFVPMISVKLPNIKLLNQNATLKLDDNSWGATNTGVWCHQISNLMTDQTYTDWPKYTQDQTIS
ncbi:hypothetical protein UFOVP758_2 [uncultured Caudovirales phage]|uniref:Uncharacterized protein n=1 Tax=uncultured Caudovirales phage TaxID=2100421 RepID=A0A6J7X9U7_9CAUD|nr:hypothetical protein UFOVP758_2 [uncultured Caudovirales phage]